MWQKGVNQCGGPQCSLRLKKSNSKNMQLTAQGLKAWLVTGFILKNCQKFSEWKMMSPELYAACKWALGTATGTEEQCPELDEWKLCKKCYGAWSRHRKVLHQTTNKTQHKKLKKYKRVLGRLTEMTLTTGERTPPCPPCLPYLPRAAACNRQP